MASTTLPLPETHEFTDVAADLLRAVQVARALFRTVGIAAAGQDDGLPCEKENSLRWSMVADCATKKLKQVRDVLVASRTPEGEWDWLTPLAMAETLDEALWLSHEQYNGVQGLTNSEVLAATNEISACLERLAAECAKAAGSASPETVEA